MKALIIFVLLGTFYQGTWAQCNGEPDCKDICCDAEIGCFTNLFPYEHLPLPKCPDQIPPSFRLYTPEHPRDEERITRDYIPPTFSPLRRTVFLVHGYLHDGTVGWLRSSRKALLDRGDFNVIQVGWYWGANEIWYPQSAGNTRAIAAEIALIADRLKTFTGISSSLLWCVGHSLGAHTCGQVGMNTPFGRVTGLDPAGPWWADYDMSAGINPTSAPFVDIIHTDGRSLIIAYGQMRPLGHYDFYPNGGHSQPGCITYYASDEEKKASLLYSEEKEEMNDIVACDHNRALHYWVESITDDCFISRESCPDEDDIPRSCSECAGGDVCAYQGYAAEWSPGGPGLYYLKTGTGWFWTSYCEG